ncbi:hypothetical protein GCM10023212_31560 [Luteolibacter yonseiensis]
MLDIFLNIDPSVIKRDLDNVEGSLTELVGAAQKLRRIPQADRTPDDSARLAHLTMLQACEVARHPNFLPEHVIFHAAYAVEGICQDATSVAFSRGQLADLAGKLREFERRDGLKTDEYWAKGDGPEDYQDISKELDELLDKIRDTLFVHILRAYHLTDIADQFENDRLTFEIDREVGRRLVSHDRITDTEDYFARIFGSEAWEKVRARLKELSISGPQSAH